MTEDSSPLINNPGRGRAAELETGDAVVVVLVGEDDEDEPVEPRPPGDPLDPALPTPVAPAVALVRSRARVPSKSPKRS